MKHFDKGFECFCRNIGKVDLKTGTKVEWMPDVAELGRLDSIQLVPSQPQPGKSLCPYLCYLSQPWFQIVNNSIDHSELAALLGTTLRLLNELHSVRLLFFGQQILSQLRHKYTFKQNSNNQLCILFQAPSDSLLSHKLVI